MIDIGKIFILRKPKQVEVSLSSDTKRVLEIHNKTSQEELDIQKKRADLEEENLKTKDRVDISLSEYTKMKDEIEHLRKFKETYLSFMKPIINSHEISDTAKQKIFEGKTNFVKSVIMEDVDFLHMNKQIKIAFYFTVEEDDQL